MMDHELDREAKELLADIDGRAVRDSPRGLQASPTANLDDIADGILRAAPTGDDSQRDAAIAGLQAACSADPAGDHAPATRASEEVIVHSLDSRPHLDLSDEQLDRPPPPPSEVIVMV